MEDNSNVYIYNAALSLQVTNGSNESVKTNLIMKSYDALSINLLIYWATNVFRCPLREITKWYCDPKKNYFTVEIMKRS